MTNNTGHMNSGQPARNPHGNLPHLKNIIQKRIINGGGVGIIYRTQESKTISEGQTLNAKELEYRVIYNTQRLEEQLNRLVAESDWKAVTTRHVYQCPDCNNHLHIGQDCQFHPHTEQQLAENITCLDL